MKINNCNSKDKLQGFMGQQLKLQDEQSCVQLSHELHKESKNAYSVECHSVPLQENVIRIIL